MEPKGISVRLSCEIFEVRQTCYRDTAKCNAENEEKLNAALSILIAHPVVHDKSNNQYATTGHPVAPGREDREVLYRDGKTTWQMAMTGAGMTWADTQNYISYLPADGPFIDGEVTRVPRADFVMGTVDMQGYLDWLNENGYDINLTVH